MDFETKTTIDLRAKKLNVAKAICVNYNVKHNLPNST